MLKTIQGLRSFGISSQKTFQRILFFLDRGKCKLKVMKHIITISLWFAYSFGGILKDQGTPDLHALIINVSPVFNSKNPTCLDLRYAL